MWAQTATCCTNCQARLQAACTTVPPPPLRTTMCQPRSPVAISAAQWGWSHLAIPSLTHVTSNAASQKEEGSPAYHSHHHDPCILPLVIRAPRWWEAPTTFAESWPSPSPLPFLLPCLGCGRQQHSCSRQGVCTLLPPFEAEGPTGLG